METRTRKERWSLQCEEIMCAATQAKGSESKELLAKLEDLLSGLISAATGGRFDNSEYQRLRNDLLPVPRLKPKLPVFLRTCRDTGAFWSLSNQSLLTGRSDGNTFAANSSQH